MPALMELVDHMGPLRLMQPAGPMESVNYSNLKQTLDQIPWILFLYPYLDKLNFGCWYLKLFVELLFTFPFFLFDLTYKTRSERSCLLSTYKLTLVSFFKNVNKQDPRAQNEWKIVAQD